MNTADLYQQMHDLGALPPHAAQVMRRWLQGVPQESGKRRIGDFLPQTLRAGLPALLQHWAGMARLLEQHAADDGATRLLVGLADGQSVESVLLPRAGLCVSTQVGCAVGCVFCMTGQGGLVRQVGSAEILAQVVLARALRRVRKVVFMGMGEPAHNLDAVMDAITLLGTHGDIAHKNLVFSTVGDERVFMRLGRGPVQPALALSLHSTRSDLRARLLPRAPRIDPAALVALAQDYAQRTHYPVLYQWTLLDGVNDDDAEVDGIVRLLGGQYAMLNLIPYNTVPGLSLRRPSSARAQAMARALRARGVRTTLRHSAGQDVDAGCGQLRARVHVVARAARPAAA